MVLTKRLTLETKGDGHILPLTQDVRREVAASGLQDGIVTVFVTGTTAAVTIMEFEPGLVKDMQEAMERLIPQGIPYQHNILNNDDNGHSHTRAAVMGPSLVIPFAGKAPILGRWQQIVMVDFDSRPRTREVVIQIMGE